MQLIADSYGRNNIKVELDLSNYVAKSDLKGLTGIDTLKFAEKADLATLKSKVDKIDVDKPETVPTYLSKLNNVVKNDIVENTRFDILVSKVNTIDSDKKNLAKKTENEFCRSSAGIERNLQLKARREYI